MTESWIPTYVSFSLWESKLKQQKLRQFDTTNNNDKNHDDEAVDDNDDYTKNNTNNNDNDSEKNQYRIRTPFLQFGATTTDIGYRSKLFYTPIVALIRNLFVAVVVERFAKKY